MGAHQHPPHQGHDHDHDHDGPGHHHDHGPVLRGTRSRQLVWALALTLGFFVVEVVAGFLSGSLALLSDAGHMLTDAGALGLALFAQVLATRERTGRLTFGFRRAEILAALINGTLLAVTALAILVEAVRRLRSPPEVLGGPMLLVAAAGLIVNLIAAWMLTRGGPANVNIRAAIAHVLSDAAGSAAAIVAAALILAFGWTLADPVVSIVISVLILIGSFRLVRASVDVLMEGVPAHLNVGDIERVIRETPGVATFHDLHVWSISDGFPLVTVHVVLAGDRHGTDVVRAVSDRIQKLVGVAHVTVQPEAPAPSHRPVPLRRPVRHRRPPEGT